MTLPATNNAIFGTLITLGNDTFLCANTPINVSGTAGFTHYTWNKGETNRMILITQPGSYWCIADAPHCKKYVDTIKVIAEPMITRLPKDTLICNSGNAAVINASSLLQNIVWSTGATSSSIVVTQPGNYWVKGSTPCGITLDTIQVRFCKPIITAIHLDLDTICEGACINLQASTQNYPIDFLWKIDGHVPDTFTDENPGSICFPTAGTYTISLRIGNAAGFDTMSKQLVVLARPVSTF